MHIFRRSTRLVATIVLLALLAAGWYPTSRRPVEAQASGGCVIGIDGKPVGPPIPVLPPLSVAPFYYTVRLTVPTAIASQIQGVIFKDTTGSGTTVLGRGQKSSDSINWTMPWYAQVATLGAHSLSAEIAGISASCPTNSYTAQTTSSPVPIIVTSTPPSYSGHTNEAFNFSLKSNVGAATGFDVTPFTVFEIQPQTLGSISLNPDNGSFHFSAGPTAGTGTIGVVAKYGGLTAPRAIGVSILPQPTSSTGDTTTSSGSSGTSNTTTTTSDQAAAANTALSIEAEPAVKDCVTSKLSPERYQAISSGQARPTAQEFEAINDCFRNRNFVLPSGFVPIAADKVKERPVNKDIKITGAETETKTEQTTEKTTIRFAGKGKPDKVVLIYVFSEPLVLSAKTNKDGDWSYSLEDPLEPGDHEAYAMVDQGDGNYSRSSVFSFAIAKVEASAANPNGYSLKIQSVQATADENNRPINLYIIGVSTMILAVMGAMGYILLKRRRLASAGVTIGVATPEASNSETTEALASEATTAKSSSAPPTETVTPPPKPLVSETSLDSEESVVIAQPGATINPISYIPPPPEREPALIEDKPSPPVTSPTQAPTAQPNTQAKNESEEVGAELKP